jgi:hypothetical protein
MLYNQMFWKMYTLWNGLIELINICITSHNDSFVVRTLEIIVLKESIEF